MSKRFRNINAALNLQYGLRRSHLICRFWQAKQSSAAPLAAVRLRRFRAIGVWAVGVDVDVDDEVEVGSTGSTASTTWTVCTAADIVCAAWGATLGATLGEKLGYKRCY
jgi:hypothetical protein